MKRSTTFRAAALVAAGLALAGCGGPPAANALLDEARTAYIQAAGDTLVATHAAVALREAEEELHRAEYLWRKDRDEDVVTHHAYLTRQRVRIAEATARLNAAQDEVERAQVERQAVQLEARAVEAERARAEADSARSTAEAEREAAERARAEAEQARLAAETALARLQEMTRRVQELEAQQTERGLVLTLSDVLFDVDKADLKPGAQRAVEALVGFLNEYPERNVRIEGFTDNTGTDAYNLRLSQERAAAVGAALVARGIAPTRITTQGYGEAFPVAGNDTPAGRQRNRRVEVIISDQEGRIPDRSQ